MADLIPDGIDLSVCNGVRAHIAVKRLRKQLLARRKAAGDRGPEGRPLCLWCLKEVPPRCRVWCSAQCDEAFYSRCDWTLLRHKVGDRDRGVCADCKLDTHALSKRYWDIYYNRSYGYTQRFAEFRKELEAIGFRGDEFGFSLWQADHIVPLAEGGSNELSNLRTLCVPCHKKATKALARRLADGRRGRLALI